MFNNAPFAHAYIVIDRLLLKCAYRQFASLDNRNCF